MCVVVEKANVYSMKTLGNLSDYNILSYCLCVSHEGFQNKVRLCFGFFPPPYHIMQVTLCKSPARIGVSSSPCYISDIAESCHYHSDGRYIASSYWLLPRPFFLICNLSSWNLDVGGYYVFKDPCGAGIVFICLRTYI